MTMSNFGAMKRLKLILSIFVIIALVLSGWSIYSLLFGSNDLAKDALNLIYFFALFIALFCVRVSIGTSNKIAWLTYVLSFTVIISSTYTWIYSVDLLLVGRYTLGLLPILIGTTMISMISSNLKWSKYAQAIVGMMALSLSVCVFTGAFGTSIYEILLIGMIFVTIVVLGLSFTARTT